MSDRQLSKFRPIEALERRQHFAGGSIDPAFGGGAVVAVGFAAGSSVMNDLITYPDGTILTGGYAIPLANAQPVDVPQMALARYRFDGQLDTSFGIGGQVYGTPRGLKNVLEMAMLDDGSFVVIGSSASGYSTRANLLLKFTPGGKVDTTFGANGKVSLPISAAALQVIGGNTIYIAGQQDRDGALLSYLSTGRPNTDFGTAGVFSTTTVFDPDVDATFLFDGITADTDGIIYASGSHRDTPINIEEPELDVRVLRLTSAGAHDPAFGGAGGFLSVRRDLLAASDSVSDDPPLARTVSAVSGSTAVAFGGVAVGDDGLPVVVGSTHNGQQAFAARLTAAGAIDPDFGENGLAELRVQPARYPIASSLQVQSDGKLVFAGITERDGRRVFGVERLTHEGVRDETYGDQGVASVLFKKLPCDARTAALAPDGSLVVGGIVGSVEAGGANDSRRFALARLFPDEGPAGQLIPKTLRNSQAGFLFDVLWRDDDGLNAITVDGGDLRLFGADGIARRAKLTSSAPSLDGKMIFARYRLPAMNGIVFTRADNGLFQVTVLGNQVFDINGTSAAKRTLGSIRIRIT